MDKENVNNENKKEINSQKAEKIPKKKKEIQKHSNPIKKQFMKKRSKSNAYHKTSHKIELSDDEKGEDSNYNKECIIQNSNKPLKYNMNTKDEFIRKLLEHKEIFKKNIFQAYQRIDKQFDNFIDQIIKIREDSNINIPNPNKLKENDKKGKKLNLNKEQNETITNSTDLNIHFMECIGNLFKLYNSFLESYKSETNVSDFIKKNKKGFLDSWIIQKLDPKKLKMHKELQEFLTQSIELFNSKDSRSRTHFKFQENDNVEERSFNFSNNKTTLTKIKFKKRENADFHAIFPKEDVIVIDEKKYNADIINKIEPTDSMESREKTKVTPTEEQYPDIKTLKIKGCNFSDVELRETFPNLIYLYIENSTFNLTKKGNRIFPNLIKLELIKMNITNDEFQKIFDSLIKNTDLLSNLEYLSFNDNKISKVEYINHQIAEDELQLFESLTELHFENNKIYKVSNEFMMLFPKLKVFNLNLNNFAFENIFLSLQQLLKKKNILLLMNQNLFAIKKRFKETYLKFFFENLKNLDYPLKKLSFETVFTKFNMDSFNNIELHPQTLINIKILNLSFCSLTDDILINFIRKNSKDKNLSNLKSLIVSTNSLTENFWNMLMEENLIKHFEALETIDFTGNEQLCQASSLTSLLLFLQQRQLKKLILFRTKFEENTRTFLKRKYLEKKPQKGEKSEKDKNDEREINKFFTTFIEELKEKQIKTKFYFRDLMGKKTLSAIQNVYKEPFDYFNFQMKVGEQALP